MFESIMNFFKKLGKSENKETKSKETAKERLHLVLMQDRANVSADFLEMMKQEIIDVIKKYIEVDEKEIDVRLTNEVKEDGTTSAPSLYANIPILNIKNEMKKEIVKEKHEEENTDTKVENKEDKDNKESKEQDDKKSKNSNNNDSNKEDENIQQNNIEEAKQEETKQTESREEKVEEKQEENKEDAKVESKEKKEIEEETDKKEENKTENEE